MRMLALLAIAVSVLVAAYFLAQGPRPEPAAQTAARTMADSLTRVRLATFEIPPRILMTGATRRGRLAWAAAELDDRAPSAGDSLRLPRLHSVAYLLGDDVWTVLLETDSWAPTWDELRTGAATGRLQAPTATGAAPGRGAERLAKRFRRRLSEWGGTRVDRGALAIGPAQGAFASGDSAVNAMLADWERRLGPPRLADDGLRTWVPRGRGVGWIEADLEVSPPGWGSVTLPLRFTGVYRERDEDDWSLVLAHLSVGVPERIEAGRASGE